MILNRQNMYENKWNHFKIVPQGHNNCQLSIVNCQFGEAAKFQFIEPRSDTERTQRQNDDGPGSSQLGCPPCGQVSIFRFADYTRFIFPCIHCPLFG